MIVAGYRLHSIAQAFERICDHQTPWVAIGDFLNDWWCFAVDQRRELIAAPLPAAPTPALQRWAAFCAATVEWLCQKDGVPCPAWTQMECYVLSEPWFYYKKWGSRSWLLATTPAPFKKRNIFVGDQLFQNKWELKATCAPTRMRSAQEMGLG